MKKTRFLLNKKYISNFSDFSTKIIFDYKNERFTKKLKFDYTLCFFDMMKDDNLSYLYSTSHSELFEFETLEELIKHVIYFYLNKNISTILFISNFDIIYSKENKHLFFIEFSNVLNKYIQTENIFESISDFESYKNFNIIS